MSNLLTASKVLKGAFVIDGCTFSEGSFQGCADEVVNSGLNAFFLTVPESNKGFQATVCAIGNIYNLTDQGEKNLMIVKNYDELIQSSELNKLGVILSFQDPHPIENSLEKLRVFYELGLRVVQLTYNKANYIGTGCTESMDHGLTDFGREIIKEMNRLGIVIDLSHCSRLTALGAIEISTQPVVFSHANVKELTDCPRNRTDEEIKLLAQRGGVIGLSPWGPLCWKKTKGKQPTLDDYLDHVDYVVNLVGVDHIGFGGDCTLDHSADLSGTREQALLYPSVVGEYNKFVGTDPSVRHAIDFKGVGEIYYVVEGLLKRGYSEADISKFLGGNFLNIVREVWK